MSDSEVEVVPGRLDRRSVSRGIDRAAARLRRSLGDGGAALLVDETASSSESLRQLARQFGIAIAPRWDRGYLSEPRARSRELALSNESDPFRMLEQRHLAATLLRVPDSGPLIVIVLNPADRSAAMRQAIESGAEVIALPRHRTTLPVDTGTVVPWRRASDLVPLLFAMKPEDFRFWSSQYRAFGGSEVGLHEARSEPIDLLDDEAILSVEVSAIDFAGRFDAQKYQGGRVTLGTLDATRNDLDGRMEALGIGVTQLSDVQEWVVGGRMLRGDRAIQVIRGDSARRFDVQVVWSGPDPRPEELLDLEEELTGTLTPELNERADDLDLWLLLADAPFVTRGRDPIAVLSAGDDLTTFTLTRSGPAGWSLRVDSDLLGAARVSVRFLSARREQFDIILDGSPIMVQIDSQFDALPIAIRVNPL